MNYVSANNEYHVPLHVKPIQSKKGGVTDAKLIMKSYRGLFFSNVLIKKQ